MKHVRPEAHIFVNMPIDHIEMDAVTARAIRVHHFFAETGIIGSKNRRDDLDGVAHEGPIAPTCLRHNARADLSPEKGILGA